MKESKPNRLKTYNLEFGDEITLNILEDLGSPAIFTQIMNNGLTPVAIEVNGFSDSMFILGPQETQIFNNGDISIHEIKLSFLDGPLNVTKAKVNLMVTGLVDLGLKPLNVK